MPYSLKGNCVYKGDKELKCYDSREDALAYFRALKANVEDSLQEMSMYITKATLHDGEMRWSATNSDTDWDLYGERMSLQLYKSMLSKIAANEPPPEAFFDMVTSDWWKGGMPYVSLAHYPDGNGKAVPGMPDKLYIDGQSLKAKGKMFDTPLGRAVWKSLKQNELDYKTDPNTDRIRISIAFLDLAHKHGETGEVFKRNSLMDVCQECKKGIGEKIYLDGYLVHLALTTVPVNPRTIMEAEDVMARKAKPTTKKEDALTILGGDESLVELVENSVLESKSELGEALVEMSETEDISEVEATIDEVAPVVEDEVLGSKSEMGGVEQVQIWKPYGGATSMKEAKKFVEAQQESWRVSDLYYTFTDVARNIMDSDEIEDKAGALATLVDEFKKSLVAKSLYEEFSKLKDGSLEENYMTIKKSEFEEVLGAVVAKAMDGYKKSESEEEDDEKDKSKVEKKSDTVSEVQGLDSAITTAKAEKSALEVSVDNLYNAVNGAVGKSLTQEEKLREIQPALEGVGQAIMDVVKKSAPSEIPQTMPANDAVLEAIQNLATKIESIGTEVATLKAQTIVPTQTNRVPVPRSIPSEVTRSLVPQQPEVKPGSVKDIVRRSVGLG